MIRSRKSRLARGFTLIELMIVVAIIGMLSSIALPAFRLIQLRTKRVEREMMLAEIERATKEFMHGREGLYVPLKADWNPPLPPSTTPRPFDKTVPGWSQLTWRPDGTMRYSYTVFENVGPTLSFTVMAIGDIDGDGKQNLKWRTWDLTGDMWGNVHEFAVDDDNGLW